MIEMKVSFDTDRERTLEDTRHWAALALTPKEKTSVEDPIEMERLAQALPIERAASRCIVSDDPDEIVDRVLPYVRLGFLHLVVGEENWIFWAVNFAAPLWRKPIRSPPAHQF